MILNEIFNATAHINWKPVSNGYRGYFSLDDNTYVIHVDEHTLNLKSRSASLIDVGFTHSKDGQESWKATNLEKHQSNILGIVKNATIEKSRELNPDIILFGAHYKNEDVDKRMRIYNFIAKELANARGWHMKENIKTANGVYSLISSFEFTKEDNNIIDSLVKQIPPK